MSNNGEGQTGKTGRMSRRGLLGGGAMLLGTAAVAQAARPRKGVSKTTSGNAANTFTVSIVGEAMLTRRFSMLTDPDFLGIVKLMRDADVAYAHLEMNLADDSEIGWAMRGSSGGAGYLVADPKLADDLAWMGVDVMSLAQNHSLDWGPSVTLATIRHCNDAGIATAGTGKNLEVARAPGFFETPKGRMALVSIASGDSAFEWAGLPKGPSEGRPGVNPLRVRTIYEVPHDTAAQLKAAGKGLGVLNDAKAAKADFNITPGASSGSNGYAGFTFRDGDQFRITTEASPADVKGNLRSIDQANAMADYVMVAQHNSTSQGHRGDDPSDFIVKFAREAIDQGADVYLGHGWHTFVGIEIYKGKPIFYGLGSFFWESQFVARPPADEYESYNNDMDTLTSLTPAAGNLHPEGTPDWGWSAVFGLKYVDKKLVEITLHPIEMGYDYSSDKPHVFRTVGRGEEKYLDGSPRLARGANARAILGKLQRLCKLRGTDMEIRGELGVIELG